MCYRFICLYFWPSDFKTVIVNHRTTDCCKWGATSNLFACAHHSKILALIFPPVPLKVSVISFETLI